MTEATLVSTSYDGCILPESLLEDVKIQEQKARNSVFSERNDCARPDAENQSLCSTLKEEKDKYAALMTVAKKAIDKIEADEAIITHLKSLTPTFRWLLGHLRRKIFFQKIPTLYGVDWRTGPNVVEQEYLEDLIATAIMNSDRSMIERSGLFDPVYYAKKYPDVAGMDLLDHYIHHGGQEGRSPSAKFRGSWYLARHPDVTIACGNPLIHYLRSETARSDDAMPSSAIYESAIRLYDDVARFDYDLSSSIDRLDIGEMPVFEATARIPVLDAWSQMFSTLRKVDFIIFVPWLVQGGADLVAATVARAIAEVRDHGSVLVVTTDHAELDALSWLPPGVELISFSALQPNLSPEDRIRLVVALIFAVRPRTIININSSACWEAIKRHGRALSNMTDLHAFLFCRDFTDAGKPVGYADTYFRDCFAALKRVYVDNRTFAEQLVREHGSPNRLSASISVLYQPAVSPIESRPFQRSDEGGTRRILWAGRFSRQKNIPLLLQVASQLPDFEFHVYGYGRGQYAEQLHQAAASRKNLVLYGQFLAPEALETDRYACMLFTSLWEGLPTTLINLAQAGLPIVASNIGGVSELIDGETGWLIHDYEKAEDYATAIREIWNNPVLARQKTRMLRHRVNEQHSWKRYISVVTRQSCFLGDE